MRTLTCLLVLGLFCAMAQDPVDARGWLNLGVQQFKAAQYAEAVASFERSAAMDPANLVPKLYLGTAYLQQYVPGAAAPENLQMAARAEEQFRRVVEADGKNLTALASLASLQLSQKKWDDAVGWYEKLLAANPGSADAYYSLGFIAWSKWYPEYAKARLAAGLQPQDPGPIADPAVRRTLSAQYGPLIEGGLQALTKALEIRPDYDDAMAYMNLLIRERADLRDNDAEYRQDVASADEWVQKALAAKRAKSQGGAANPAVGPRPPAPTRIMIAGNVQEARLIKRVDPAPTSFRGEVVLQIVVDRTGKVSDIKVTSGHPMLIANAMDAVKQWLYQVTLLNGNPVEVSTQVTLTF